MVFNGFLMVLEKIHGRFFNGLLMGRTIKKPIQHIIGFLMGQPIKKPFKNHLKTIKLLKKLMVFKWCFNGF